MSEICPCCGDELVEIGEHVMCIREDYECGYTASIVSNNRLCGLQAENEKLRAENEELRNVAKDRLAMIAALAYTIPDEKLAGEVRRLKQEFIALRSNGH